MSDRCRHRGVPLWARLPSCLFLTSLCVFMYVTSPTPESNGEPSWNIHSVTLSLQYLHWKTTRIQLELPTTLQPLSSAFGMTEFHMWRQPAREIGLCLEALVIAADEQPGQHVCAAIRMEWVDDFLFFFQSFSGDKNTRINYRSLFGSLICLSAKNY